MAAGTIIPSVQMNSNLNYVFTSIDPTSLILSQFSHTFHQPPQHHQIHHLTSQGYYMERGSRYQEYAALREYKLRMKKNMIKQQEQEQDDDFNLVSSLSSSSSSQMKQSKSPTTKARKSLSSKGSSVSRRYPADFGSASASKKENGRPAMATLSGLKSKSGTYDHRILSPATSGLKSKSGTYDGILGKMVGRKKSFAGLETLKGLGSQARKAINGENKGMRTPGRNYYLDKTQFSYSTQF